MNRKQELLLYLENQSHNGKKIILFLPVGDFPGTPAGQSVIKVKTKIYERDNRGGRMYMP